MEGGEAGGVAAPAQVAFFGQDELDFTETEPALPQFSGTRDQLELLGSGLVLPLREALSDTGCPEPLPACHLGLQGAGGPGPDERAFVLGKGVHHAAHEHGRRIGPLPFARGAGHDGALASNEAFGHRRKDHVTGETVALGHDKDPGLVLAERSDGLHQAGSLLELGGARDPGVLGPGDDGDGASVRPALDGGALGLKAQTAIGLLVRRDPGVGHGEGGGGGRRSWLHEGQGALG